MGEDAELMLSYCRGDVSSLAALVARHSVWMQALLRSLLPTTDDADDAFQETWVRVMRSAGRYHGGSVKAYLATVARSAAIDRLRRCGRMTSLDVDDDSKEMSAAEQIPDESPLPSERFESKATAEDVRRAVQSLPAGPRQVLLLRIEGEVPFKEIAAELGVPIGTALTWMRYATMKLKKMLGERQ